MPPAAVPWAGDEPMNRPLALRSFRDLFSTAEAQRAVNARPTVADSQRGCDRTEGRCRSMGDGAAR